MNMHATKIVLCLNAGQTFRLEERSEYVLEPFELGPEALQHLRGSATALPDLRPSNMKP